ncbi:MAG TPA: alpha/beta hydrolase [Steroidobacteraceae bacterium]|nr:alpha/beta hydrolase [Steroidobacteraceae bacterium]
MKVTAAGGLSLALAAMLAMPASAGAGNTALARRASQNESYPGVTVQYEALTDAAGERLRLILTSPRGSSERLPVIFVAGWLSCDTVEAPPGDRGAPQQLFQTLAQLPGFATVRLEKPGVGDSQGDCAATDFAAELAAYQQAFRTLGSFPFADVQRVFVLGLSNGGGFAPLVAQGAPVRGYVVVGGWIKTWFEHMLEIERRRLALSGVPGAQMDAQMQAVERLYSAYLLEDTPPREILARHPELRHLWEADPQHQYGRPVRYYQQLQQLELMRAWSQVQVPLLALHGEYDWIMSRDDLELMVQLVNQNVPGSARFQELPQTGHTLEHDASQADAFAAKALPFDATLAAQIGAWFTAHR